MLSTLTCYNGENIRYSIFYFIKEVRLSMFDWNNDGKHDWRDDAFYNNVIAPKDKSSSYSCGGSSNHNNSSNNNHYSSSSNGWAWFVVVCVIYLLIKLIA